MRQAGGTLIYDGGTTARIIIVDSLSLPLASIAATL